MSATGAIYESQGQARSEAECVAPGNQQQYETRPEGPKYGRNYALSGLGYIWLFVPGATRFALARGCHIAAPLALYCNF
jgi:hypothetical protein